MEAGIGTIGASDTFARTRVTATFDGTTYNNRTPSALSLPSGTHKIYITEIAESVFTPMPSPLTGPTNVNVASANFVGTQSNTGTAATQRPTAWPFLLNTSGVLTAMGITVGATGAGSSVLLGLYDVKSNGNPGRRIAMTTAAIDTSTGGGTLKTQSVDNNVRLTPGWYWAALVVTGGTNPTFASMAQTSSAFGFSGNVQIVNVREDVADATLPDPFATSPLVYVLSSAQAAAVIINLILS
jgi:hypothetical protein